MTSAFRGFCHFCLQDFKLLVCVLNDISAGIINNLLWSIFTSDFAAKSLKSHLLPVAFVQQWVPQRLPTQRLHIKEASVSSAVCFSTVTLPPRLSFLLGNDLRLLFSRPGSISSLFKKPKGGGDLCVCSYQQGAHRESLQVWRLLIRAAWLTHTHMRREGAAGGSLLLGEQQTSGRALIISHQTRFYKTLSGKAWKHGEAFESSYATKYWIKATSYTEKPAVELTKNEYKIVR